MGTVLPMPQQLDRLAGKIREDLIRRGSSRAEWASATLDLCIHLAEAKGQFKNTKTFGLWWNDNGFDLNSDERAAAIKMGQHIEEARKVLEQTKRISLDTIYRTEFKTSERSEVSSTAKPKRRSNQISDEQEIAIAVAILDLNKTRAEAKELFGVSAPVIRRAVRAEQVRREGKPSDPSTFSKTRQADYDRALRSAEARLRIEVEATIREEIRQRYDEIVIPFVNAKHDRAERIIASHRGLMERAAYRKILGCLHPDNIDETRKKRWEEAFHLFKSLEDVLVKPDPTPPREGVPPLPQTLGELLARKKAPRSNK